MTIRAGLRSGLGALAIVVGLAASPLQAQQGARPPGASPGYGWSGYTPSNAWQGSAPGYAWPTYTPSSSWNGYAPSAPAAANPALAASTGARIGAWQGYAPGTAWNGYSPGTAWRGYTPGPVVQATTWRGNNPPNRPGELYSFHSGVAGIYGTSVVAIPPTAYRELGTGRPVPISKPWLPNSP